MSDNHLKQFSNACQGLYAPGLCLGNYADRGFQFLQALVPGEFVACGELDVQNENLGIVFDNDHPDIPRAMEALGALMSKYEMYSWDPKVNNGRPFCRRHFFREQEFRNLDIYQEVYQPLGIDNHCAVYVPTRPDHVMYFGIERVGKIDFSEPELRLLEVAQRQLASAYQLAASQAELMEAPLNIDLLVQAGLTPREAEALYWMDQGKSNPEIALVLSIQVYTVKDHIRSIFNKVGVDNRIAAIVWGRRTCFHYLQLADAASRKLEVPVRQAAGL